MGGMRTGLSSSSGREFGMRQTVTISRKPGSSENFATQLQSRLGGLGIDSSGSGKHSHSSCFSTLDKMNC